ncbi:MAG: serine hydrolase [Spirosomataceae bacterium]
MPTTRRIFLQQLAWAGVGSMLLSPFSADLLAKPKLSLPRSTPESQGMDSAGIVNFLDAIAQSNHEFHSLMIVRHGKVVAEGWWSPYGANIKHTLYSMSKSFTSTAIGFLVAEKKLKVSDKVVSFFPEELPDNVSENLASLTIKDLLSMAVGHETEPSIRNENNWVKAFLAWPIKNIPGTTFLYNSMATYMCSAIVQRVSGQKLIDYLTPRLFVPLGIEDADWEEDGSGINTGGWGLRVRTEDLAKFGQLYLQKGVWNGQQILPKAWVEEATSFKIQQPSPAKPTRPNAQNDWLQGYCYQFWRCRHNAYRGDGAFGQYTIVMPDQEAVIAITSETSNMQGILDLIWTHLLPAMKTESLPTNMALSNALKQRMNTLTLPPAAGGITNHLAIANKVYQMESNDSKVESIRLLFDKKGGFQVQRKDAMGIHVINGGIERWVLGQTDLARPNLVVSSRIKTSTEKDSRKRYLENERYF